MRHLWLILLAGWLTACGGGGGGSDDTAPPPTTTTTNNTVKLTEIEAAEFLNRSTFGATREGIDELVELGIEDWLSAQYAARPSYLRAYLQTLPDQDAIYHHHRVNAWWLQSVHGPDQLRQRVAFALSQIFVTSDRSGALEGHQMGLANYYDIFVRNAFGNYRDILEQVTLSPVMGVYLSMLGNQKPDVENNIRPDENYAREVMQLFTIGLVELNTDGSSVMNGANNPVPSYDQDIIEGFAHVFTGWTFANAESYRWPERNMLLPMEPFEEYHDTGSKTLLNGFVVPAGQTADEDLQMALDNLFEHPNVGPFISHKLIQRLVTSNPTPEYIARVARVFNNNGQGVRGDMQAVIEAILTDDEALNGRENLPNQFGKLREPLIRTAHFWRAFDALAGNGEFNFGYPDYVYGQAPQSAPHVFNFYSPFYQPPGELSQQSMAAPEFQINTSNNLTGYTNSLLGGTIWKNEEVDNDEQLVYRNMANYMALAEDTAALVDELALVFMAGNISSTMRDELIAYADGFSENTSDFRKVLELTFLILSSAEYTVQQ